MPLPEWKFWQVLLPLFILQDSTGFRRKDAGHDKDLGNSGTQYHPNSREFVQSVRLDSDWTTRNYFRPVSDQNQVVPTGSNQKDSQKSNINRSPDIRIKSKALVIQNNY